MVVRRQPTLLTNKQRNNETNNEVKSTHTESEEVFEVQMADDVGPIFLVRRLFWMRMLSVRVCVGMMCVVLSC